MLLNSRDHTFGRNYEIFGNIKVTFQYILILFNRKGSIKLENRLKACRFYKLSGIT